MLKLMELNLDGPTLKVLKDLFKKYIYIGLYVKVLK